MNSVTEKYSVQLGYWGAVYTLGSRIEQSSLSYGTQALLDPSYAPLRGLYGDSLARLLGSQVVLQGVCSPDRGPGVFKVLKQGSQHFQVRHLQRDVLGW